VIHEKTNTDYWSAYIDDGFAARQPVDFDDASFVLAGGEFSTISPLGLPWGYIYGCFGCTGGTPWQRTLGSSDPSGAGTAISWKTVRTARLQKDDSKWSVGNPLFGPFVIQRPNTAP
jgi:hypothetical protein